MTGNPVLGDLISAHALAMRRLRQAIALIDTGINEDAVFSALEMEMERRKPVFCCPVETLEDVQTKVNFALAINAAGNPIERTEFISLLKSMQIAPRNG